MADTRSHGQTDRDDSMKMLSLGTACTAPANVGSSVLPASPSAEYSEDNVNRLSAYLHALAGHSRAEESAVVKDHPYARPWNWKPDNVYVKPVKKIFFSKTLDSASEQHNTLEDIEVDVDSNVGDPFDPPDRSVPYDLTRIRHHMDEFQRLANFARPDEGADDWEEKIDKMLWLPIHHRVFSKVSRILASERLARLAKSKCRNEPIFRRTSVDTAARRFRETLASAGWDWKVTQWLHCLLFDHLPREYLAIYLDILQTLRAKIPQLIDRMMSVQPNINARTGSITWETLGSLLKRSWDPLATCLNSNRPKKLPGNPILIVAPSGIGTNVSSRQHKWISQLGSLGMVVNVHMHLGLTAGRMTMMTCIDQLVQATRAKIQDVRGDCPGRPIIIIGFNSGAALACQVAQMEHVTAVICLGFPLTTVEGKRGTPDDTLMDIRCPVMFVIGQNATLVSPDDLEDIREKMLVETSLVVVGTADDHLRISTSKKISEGITQSMVDRCVLDEIGDFVASILLQPHPLPLRTASSYDNVRTMKKEPRKRKNSTSSSVDSETNSPNVKKNRSGTPAVAAPMVSSSFGNSMPMLLSSRSLPSLATQTALVAVGSGGGPTVAAAGAAYNPNQMPVQKKRPRATNSQKNHFPDHIVTSKGQQQTACSGNGGITLNIGSLASLAPIGPITLGPAAAGQTATTNVKGNLNSRSTVSLSKMPKMIPTTVAQPSMTKIKTVVSTSSKGFSKLVSASNYKKTSGINVLEKGNELNSVNITNTAENQIRVSANVASTVSAPQNRPPGNAITSGALTALLQSGKSPLGLVGNAIAGRGIAVSSSNILPTASSNSSPAASTITTPTVSKVTDSAVIGGRNERIQTTNTTISSTKKYPIDTTFGSVVTPTENCRNGRAMSSPVIMPLTNKAPVTILPLSCRTKTVQKNPTAKTMPKITINSNNHLHKAQRGKFQYPLTPKKPVANDIDDDLSNILDIPIIFAKDGDNLSIMEKSMCLGQNRVPISIEPVERSVKRLSSTTKVVLISNKQDKSKNPNHQGVAQVILQSRSQNSVKSIGTNWNGSLSQLQSTSRPNPPTIKYTKIILAKRNYGGVTGNSNSAEKIEQIVSGNKTRTHEITNAEDVEIEDAIKTNIIERKLLTIPEIDLTSPTKNQLGSESSIRTNIIHPQAGMEQ